MTPETVVVYATRDGRRLHLLGALTHSAPGLDLSLAPGGTAPR